jgi:hypothetical protein
MREGVQVTEPADEVVFRGTLMGGPEVDLIGFSGLQLGNRAIQAIWDQVTPARLLVDVLGCEEVEAESPDGEQGMFDAVYEYRCGAREAFLTALRAALLKLAGEEAGR